MVSPRVVAAIFMIQKASVTSGSFFITDLVVLATSRPVRNSDCCKVGAPVRSYGRTRPRERQQPCEQQRPRSGHRHEGLCQRRDERILNVASVSPAPPVG